VLLKYATDDCVLSTSREALRCLANIMLLQTSSRQMVADSGYLEKLAERYKVRIVDYISTINLVTKARGNCRRITEMTSS
jgi:hypothetical protein